MRADIRDGMLVLIPETDADHIAFAAWREAHEGHVFYLKAGGGALRDLGPRETACNEPINIGFKMPEARWRLVSNLAATPFTLRGRAYASVEGF